MQVENPEAEAAVKDEILLAKINDRVLQVTVTGEDTQRDLAKFMGVNLTNLRDVSNGTYIAPEASAVLRWLGGEDRSTYLTLTEFLQNLAGVFADICEIVRPSLGAKSSDAEVKSRAYELTQEVCSAILLGREPVGSKS